MTSPTPPNSTPKNTAPYSAAELLELASADALGLLDEQERRDFEAAFAVASPRVQALIRDQQLLEARQQIASLPEVIQPLSLRERVLSKVFGFASADSAVAGRIDGSLSGSARMDSRIDPGLDRRLSQSLPPMRHVSRWWRAGAIGSLAAVVALGVMTLQMRGMLDKINRDMATGQVADTFRVEFTGRFETALVNPGTKLVQFASTQTGDSSPKAAVLINPTTKTGQLVCKDLPEARAVVLTMTLPGGESKKVVTTFTPSNARAFVQLDGLSTVAGTRYELRVAGTDELLMTATMS
jgi:hypothetical protein